MNHCKRFGDFDEVPCRIEALSFTRFEAMLKESMGRFSLGEDLDKTELLIATAIWTLQELSGRVSDSNPQ